MAVLEDSFSNSSSVVRANSQIRIEKKNKKKSLIVRSQHLRSILNTSELNIENSDSAQINSVYWRIIINNNTLYQISNNIQLYVISVNL